MNKYNYWLLKEPIFFGVFYLFLIIISSCSTQFYPFTSSFYKFMLLAWLTLTIGFLTSAVCSESKIYSSFSGININLLGFLSICVVLNVICSIFNYVDIVGYKLDLSKYRQYLTFQHNAPLAIKYNVILNFACFSIIPYIIINQIKLSKVKLFSLLSLLLIFGIISTSRSFFVIVFVFSLFSYLLTSKFDIRNAFIALALVVCIFFIFPFFLGKSSSFNTFLVYLVGGVHVIDKVLMEPPQSIESGLLTFSFLNSILSKFGYMDPRPFLNYFYVPLPTNVYSMLGVYLIDYGYCGALFCSFLIGMLSGFLDKYYEITNSSRAIYLKSLNLTALTLSFFYDYYTCSTVFLALFMFSLTLPNKYCTRE